MGNRAGEAAEEFDAADPRDGDPDDDSPTLGDPLDELDEYEASSAYPCCSRRC